MGNNNYKQQQQQKKGKMDKKRKQTDTHRRYSNGRRRGREMWWRNEIKWFTYNWLTSSDIYPKILRVYEILLKTINVVWPNFWVSRKLVSLNWPQKSQIERELCVKFYSTFSSIFNQESQSYPLNFHFWHMFSNYHSKYSSLNIQNLKRFCQRISNKIFCKLGCLFGVFNMPRRVSRHILQVGAKKRYRKVTGVFFID